jgi:hypothetical protein
MFCPLFRRSYDFYGLMHLLICGPQNLILGSHLDEAVTRGQGHLVEVLDVPRAHDHPPVVRIVPDRFDHILQLKKFRTTNELNV